MKNLKAKLSLAFIVPLSIANANADLVKVHVSADDMVTLQNIEMVDSEIEFDVNESTIKASSALINELKESGVIQVENASSGQDCLRT